MVLNHQQRDVLRSKLDNRLRYASDDHLIAVLVLVGYSLDEIDQFVRDF